MTVASVNLELSGALGLEGVVDIARGAIHLGAELVVLPECAILELLGPHPEVGEAEAPGFLAAYEESWIAAFAKLSRQSGAVVVAGTVFSRSGPGILNVCPIVFSDGTVHRAAKNRLTTYEKEIWGLVPGEGLAAFENPPFGVAICYDSEFPEAARALAEAGARLICVPAFTEGKRGFQRVRWCCQARAVENQVFVIHASLVGSLGREPVPNAYGSSAILSPSIEPFPESAVLAGTGVNEPGIALAELDFRMLEVARSSGDVLNWEDREPRAWGIHCATDDVRKTTDEG